MMQFLFRRLLGFIPTLFVMAVVIALMVDFIPGDPVRMFMGLEAPAVAIVRKRQELGLDRPIQVRLVEWLANAAQGDLGDSWFLSQSVSATIADRYPVTIALAALATLISVIFGVSIGIISAVNQGSFIDWIAMLLSLVTLSLPGFWLALILIYFFGVKLGWFPVGGYVDAAEDPVAFIRYLILPATVLGLGSAPFIVRFTRTSFLEVLRQDYITVARAKGLRERIVLYRHALRNAMVPIVTTIGIQAGVLLGGAVIIEYIFNIPGVGRMVIDAVKRRDYPLIQGSVLVVAASYLVINLLTDVLYALIDPRIRY